MTPRLILLVNSTVVPFWIARLARRLASLDYARVEAVSSLDLPPSPRASLDIFLALDQRLQRGASDLFAPSDLRAALPNVPFVKPSEVSSYQLDILISFCSDDLSLRGGRASRRSNPLPGEGESSSDDGDCFGENTLAKTYKDVSPRIGIWIWNSLAPSTGFREVLVRAPLMTCDLLAHLPSGETKLLRRAVFATDWISAARNRNHFFIKVESTLLWALKKLSLEGEEKFYTGAQSLPTLHRSLETLRQAQDNASDSDASIGLGEIAALAVKQTARKLEKYFRPRETWLLLAGKTPAGLVPELGAARPIVPPRGVYWADPMAVVREGQLHVFVEEYVRENRRGRIVCLTLEDGQVASRQVALERPYHLSYPFVFEWRGETWMVPETSAQRTVELYRCARWPDRWEFARNLMSDAYAVDATLLEHGGRWWLFANVKSEAGASSWDELHLFYADEPTSARWTPHPLNPVVSDVRLARPAGRIFEFEGRLYRPSQDCSVRYGYALNFNRVETLTERDYAETRMETIFPRPGMRTLHTFARAGGWDVVDGARLGKIVDK